jgi:hypothetical protein
MGDFGDVGHTPQDNGSEPDEATLAWARQTSREVQTDYAGQPYKRLRSGARYYPRKPLLSENEAALLGKLSGQVPPEPAQPADQAAEIQAVLREPLWLTPAQLTRAMSDGKLRCAVCGTELGKGDESSTCSYCDEQANIKASQVGRMRPVPALPRPAVRARRRTPADQMIFLATILTRSLTVGLIIAVVIWVLGTIVEWMH